MIGNTHNPFPPFIETVLNTLHRLIGPLFLIGGTVRNVLQNKDLSNELNVLVSIPLPECQRRLLRAGYESVTMGSKHNSLVLPLKGHGRTGAIEIAAIHHRPDHLPTVEEDLFNRDLTINAMAFAWPSGPLIDPMNGQKDLMEGRIRFVRGMATLEEDALRALRLFRFTLQLAGEADQKELHAAEHTSTHTVSKARLRGELDRILSLPFDNAPFHPLIWRFFRSPLVRGIFVDITEEPLCEVGTTAALRWEKAIGMVMGMTSPDREEEIPLLDLRWAALFHEIGELSCISQERGTTRSIHRHAAHQRMAGQLKRLCFSHRRQRRILTILEHAAIDLVPTDRILLRLMANNTPLEGLFRLVHARELTHTSSSRAPANDTPGDKQPPADSVRDPSLIQTLNAQLAKVLARCRLLQMACQRPSPRDLAISGGEILDLVRQPPGPWVSDITDELLDCISHDPACNVRPRLRGKVRAWIAKQPAI